MLETRCLILLGDTFPNLLSTSILLKIVHNVDQLLLKDELIILLPESLLIHSEISPSIIGFVDFNENGINLLGDRLLNLISEHLVLELSGDVLLDILLN